MNDSDQIPLLVKGLIMLVMVASALSIRRAAIGQLLRYALIWLFIFAAAMVLFSFKSDGQALLARVATAFSPEIPRVAGNDVRIERDEDGHFMVRAMINGQSQRLLIDTGASNTALSRKVAQAVGIDIDDTGFGVLVETANGTTTMRRGRARRIVIGSIVREDQPVWISEGDDLNVLGMNFLNSLGGWRVEGRTMILSP